MGRMLKRKSSKEKKNNGKETKGENDEKKSFFRKQEEALSLQRTTTILEMMRWQNEQPNHFTHVEISVGNESTREDENETDVLATHDAKETPSTPLRNNHCTKKEDDSHKSHVDVYMASREMTITQERGNALTMIPSPLYCIYYILAGKWLTNASHILLLENTTTSTDDCIQSAWFPQLHSMPPLAVTCVALGILLHAPFSFVYHWHYAPLLKPGIARTDHVSRRLDQAMIHVASAFFSYATSGSVYYFGANVLYNADCAIRQFQREVRVFVVDVMCIVYMSVWRISHIIICSSHLL